MYLAVSMVLFIVYLTILGQRVKLVTGILKYSYIIM